MTRNDPSSAKRRPLRLLALVAANAVALAYGVVSVIAVDAMDPRPAVRTYGLICAALITLALLCAANIMFREADESGDDE
jgi:hypothetical protein